MAKLPDGYTQLTALHHKAYGGFDLTIFGFKYKTDMVLELTAKFEEAINASNSGYNIFANFYAYGYASQFAVNADFNKITVTGSGSGSYSTHTSIEVDIEDDLTKKFKLTIDRTSHKKIKINYNVYDAELNKVLSDTYGSAGNYLFSYHGSLSPQPYIKGYLYKFNVYQSNTLILSLIPCINSNNAVGLYDTVGKHFEALDSSVWEAYIEDDTELEQLMKQRGLEKLEEHIKFESVDGTIATGSMSYTYGTDFKLGDFVSVYSKKLDMMIKMQITSITKSISNGVEILDIGFGKDRLIAINKEERSMY